MSTINALVTDEAVKLGAKEARAWGVKSSHGDWSDEETQRNCARDILKAAAPLIAAQALEDLLGRLPEVVRESAASPEFWEGYVRAVKAEALLEVAEATREAAPYGSGWEMTLTGEQISLMVSDWLRTHARMVEVDQ